MDGRDPRGRFTTGNGFNARNGRRQGARNRLSEGFLEDFAEVWCERGREAIKRLAADDPGTFVRVAASIMPKDFQVTVGAERLGIREVLANIEATAGHVGIGSSHRDGRLAPALTVANSES